MANAICGYDFTCPCDEIRRRELIEWLKEHCKKWVFQKEEGGETGYLHYQGRMSMKEKIRIKQLIELKACNGMRLSPTSNQNLGNVWYVIKPDTRVAGPWSDKDKEKYIPRQIRDIELKPWQQEIADDADNWDTRTINIVINRKGNIGKSTLCTYIGVHEIGRSIPPINDQVELLQIVYDMPTAKLYVMDMPKAMTKDKLYGIYGALETIKSGYCYDKRYTFKERYFDCPNIWVFTNVEPDKLLLSKDRWRLWKIEDDELVDY